MVVVSAPVVLVVKVVIVVVVVVIKVVLGIVAVSEAMAGVSGDQVFAGVVMLFFRTENVFIGSI